MTPSSLKHVKVEATDFPSLKNEDWRYTEVAKLVGEYVVPPKARALESKAMPAREPDYSLTFVDGFLVSQRLPREVQFKDGTLYVKAGAVLRLPVTIYYRGQTAAGAWQLNLNLKLGSGARLTLREHYQLAADSFAKTQLNLTVGSRAQLTHSIETNGDASARLISRHSAEVARAAHYQLQLVSVGYTLTRHELDVRLNGQGAEVELRGVQLVRSSQTGTHVSVDHCAPNTKSTQVFRGVVRGNGSAICHSKVFIRKAATQSQSDQSLKTILLDAESKGFARPELHVANDQVQCQHGSAVGPLSSESLFYLKSRGLTEELARQTLVRAFVSADLTLADELFGNLEEVLA